MVVYKPNKTEVLNFWRPLQYNKKTIYAKVVEKHCSKRRGPLVALHSKPLWIAMSADDQSYVL